MKTKYENATGEPSAAQRAERLVCPLCGSRDANLVSTKAIALPGGDMSFRLWRCAKCDLVRTEPRLAPEALASFYGEQYWGDIQDADPDWIRRDQRHRTAFLHRFRDSGRILDVGCGLGFFLRALDPARWDRYGVEPMPLPHGYAANAVGSDRIAQAPLAASALPPERFDVVTFWDSLEHLADPRAELLEARRVLRPGGLVLIALPNFGSYQARHFGEDWYHLSLPHHLYHFTRPTLTRLLDSCGFGVRVLEDRAGPDHYHALKHSFLNRMTRLYGQRSGWLRYYAAKPFLQPWEWISTRWGGGSSFQVCAEAVPRDEAGSGL
jgi:SAM-dependent methyltransferase